MYPTSIRYEPRAPATHNSIANEDLLSSITIIGTTCTVCWSWSSKHHIPDTPLGLVK